VADTLSLNGSIQTRPTQGNPSGDPEVIVTLTERVGLINKSLSFYQLTADSPVSVGFGGLTNCNVLMIKVEVGKVRARITSADGTSQAVPVDTLLILFSSSVPVTAIDLTRVAGVDTTVRVFLGERS